MGRARLRQLTGELVDSAGADHDGHNLLRLPGGAIQRTGAPVSTMIIGTLPVVQPVFANLFL